MSERELVLHHLSTQMIAAFEIGDLIDAQNINTLLRSMEGISDRAYEEDAAAAEGAAEFAEVVDARTRIDEALA